MDHIFTGDNWNYISSRLRTRLLLFIAIAIALVVFALYEMVIGDMTWLEGIISLVVGVIIGYIYGRLIRVQWSVEEEKVVRNMDVIGFVIIGVYLLLSLSRDWLLGHFFTGATLTAIGATVAGGILIGRFFGMQVSLLRTIRENRPVAKVL